MDSIRTLTLFIRLARPHFLLGGILLFALGGGIARYLGHPIDWGPYFVGQAWVTMMQLSTHFLNEFFNAPADVDNTNRTLFSGGSGAIGPGKLPRAAAFWGGLASLGATASFTVLLIAQGSLTPVVVLVMVLIFLGAFFYAAPPLRLESTGYGELTTSILVAGLVPGFGLLLQTGELHRLLPMVTFPLVLLHLAMLLAFELPDYANDLKYEKRTIMVRVGWETGMRLHNFTIFGAYFMFGVALAWGLPFSLAFPAMLTFPLGLFQVWNMHRIASGGKPLWNIVTLTAIAIFAVTAYLLAFSFWSR
jgi:1,4-dihydroxy-2-naphthoate polyprenyltransferase